MVGIVGYGVYIPYLRIKVENILDVWKNTTLGYTENLNIKERTVLQPDEDVVTLAIEASHDALERSGVGRNEIKAVYLGTCTNPYDSRPSSTIIAESLGLPYEIMCADVQFSGKSGTAAMQICMSLVESGMTKYGLAIGADTINRHIAPGNIYEYTASAGAAAFVIGREKVAVEIDGTSSYATDLSDFFRIEGERYIKFTGFMWEIGLIDHVKKASQNLMKKLQTVPEDYTYAVFQQPYGNTPLIVGKTLGFREDQIYPGIVSSLIGDCGAASSLIGLANVLDTAKSGDRIFLASYGFGAGSDAFSLTVKPSIENIKGKGRTVRDLINRKSYVDYATAAKLEYKYLKEQYPLGVFF